MLARQRRSHRAQSPGASPYGTRQVCSWENGDQWVNGIHAGVKLQQDQDADKLVEILRLIENAESVERWTELLLFTFSCFGVPGQRGGKRHSASLASKVNMAIASFPAAVSSSLPQRQKPSKFRPTSDNLAARVSSKLEDGDVRGAIRLAASDDTMAPFDDDTAAALRVKHPTRAASDVTPPTPCIDTCLYLQESDVLAAIKSFVPGSAGGTDGLRPQHLKDLTSVSSGDAGRRLLTRITEFTNLCLKGLVPVVIQPIFCGALLCALNKKKMVVFGRLP